MSLFQRAAAVAAVLLLPLLLHAQTPAPPVAPVKPKVLSMHGHDRTDNYYWMNDRTDPGVLSYLAAENAYTDTMLAGVRDLRETLFQEIRGRIKQTDMSVPYTMDDYVYYTRFEEGKDYPFFCRKPAAGSGAELVMLDVNALAAAAGSRFYQVGGLQVSSGQNLVAFAVDTMGRRIHTIRFRDLASGRVLEDAIPNVTGNMAWAGDNRTLFYTRQDPQTLRSFQVYRHTLGTPASEDVLVFEEKDETFSCFVVRTKSKRFILIGSDQTLSSEYRYLDADAPGGEFTVIAPRERDHEYSVDHAGDHFYIRTNRNAKNFRLMKAPVATPGERHWTEVVPHRADVLLEGFEIFRDHLVLTERRRGLIHLRIMPWNGDAPHDIAFTEASYTAGLDVNRNFNTGIVRFSYSSPVTPSSVYDYDMVSRTRTLLKRDTVLGGFDPSAYTVERLYARAADGVEVPMTVVYRKDLPRNGKNPALVYGYGSYGISSEARFSSPALSLLNRGFIMATANIRGGQEMGRDWYENGKLLTKKNTFTDFIACAEHLVKEGYTSPRHMYALGGSAGGLLIGAVVNMRPDLFHGAIAKVPFVDVVTTMLDASIPLTTAEYDEWGNPNEKPYYDYMLSYSPYDNVERKAYPNLLVTAGLHDSQVQYWEPAKWVAKLRTMNTGGNLVLLKMNMEAGHGGASARQQRYREIALDYAFLLHLEKR
jgi:oligopeptidase B